jgi:hypothetical protein
MTGQPQFGEPGWKPTMVTAPVEAAPISPHFRQAAAQAVSEAQAPDQGTDAGDSVRAMQDAAVRAAMSDYERRLHEMMDAAEKQNAAWAEQFAAMQRQLATVQAQAGPPTAALLSQSLAQRVKSIAIAHPDLGMSHFAGVISQTESLADEVKAVAAGEGDQRRVEQLAAGVEQWFTRVHRRASGKFLEGADAALEEAERIVEELPKIVPVAGTLLAAVV